MLSMLTKAALITATLSMFATFAQAAQEVKVGMSGRYFPFTFSKNDQLQGFEVDVWNEIAKRNDYEVKFVTASFSGLFGMLETGRVDTISNQITISPERLAKYAFSQPYVYDGAQIVVRRGNDSIQKMADLSGKKVAVNLGSNFEQILRQQPNADAITIVTYDTNIEQDVALGRMDAFVMDRVSSAQLIKESPLPLQLAGDPIDTIENAMPFLNTPQQVKLRDEVDVALTAMKADGTLAAISQKWFDADITQP